MVNVKGAGRTASSNDDDGNRYSSGETDGASQQDYSQDSLTSPEVSEFSSLRLENDKERLRNYGLANSRLRGSMGTHGNDKIFTNVTRQLHGLRQIRGSGSTSYISLVKRTEDDMELVKRTHTGLTQPSAANGGIRMHPGGQENKFKGKRRAVTLLFGHGMNIPHAAHTVRSAGISSKHEVRSVDGSDSSDTEISFPLRNMAAGGSSNVISIREAKSLENAAKRKEKVLKKHVGLAKLDVVEAKLAEFAATLEVRQAKIEERQAKLCRRRAALKQAEVEQDSLEVKMDEEEESHRARERRIKNRERRVRQEEAGLFIKESSLRKREVTISQEIDKIERWREIVDEKENVQKRMGGIVESNEELHGRDMTAGNLFGTLSRKLRSKKRNKKEASGEPQSFSVRSEPSALENYPKPKARTSISGSGRTKRRVQVPDAFPLKKNYREKGCAIQEGNE